MGLFSFSSLLVLAFDQSGQLGLVFGWVLQKCAFGTGGNLDFELGASHRIDDGALGYIWRKGSLGVAVRVRDIETCGFLLT